MSRWWSLCTLLAVTSAPAQSLADDGTDEEGTTDYRAATALGLTGAYVGFGGWTWLAWYRDRPKLPRWTHGGDGGFGVDSYAGGADKVGHAWSTFVLTRLGADLLEAGGWSEVAASAISSGLCLGAFTMIEVNDGYYTEFSPGDLGADVVGVGAALAMRHIPLLDDAFDFRVQWFPSREFRRSPSANFAEDYSGQTYLLAFKPGVLAAVRQSRRGLQVLQFINPAIAFESRNYIPEAPAGQRVQRRQTLFLGATIDVQAILGTVWKDATSPAARASKGAAHALFEYVNLPFATARLVTSSREESFVVPSE